MNRSAFPGGSYVEALPSGEYAALMADHVQTHETRIPLPPEGAPLYLRITNVPSFQIAGQASQAAGTLHWRDGQWHLDPRIAHGVSGCIFDAQGVLRVIEPAPGQTSQGYRYVDFMGTLVLGDSTYGPRFGLNEWSNYADVCVGQGHDFGGVGVFDGNAFGVGNLHVLDTGDCRFIRVRGEGESVAISYWKQGEGAVIVQTTLSELRALPRVSVNTSPQVPTNPNTESNGNPSEPHTKTEPVPVSIPNQLETVKAIRAKYPTPLGAQHGAFLVEVAKAVGGKLYRKPGGDHTTLPDGTPVSLDIVIVPPYWVDILGDAENTAQPAWDVHENAEHPENWVDVSTTSTQPPQNPPPVVQPPAPSVDLSGILESIEELRRDVDAIIPAVLSSQGAIEAKSAEAWMDIRNRLDALAARKAEAGEMYGSVTMPYIGTGRVDLLPGPRPKK